MTMDTLTALAAPFITALGAIVAAGIKITQATSGPAPTGVGSVRLSKATWAVLAVAVVAACVSVFGVVLLNNRPPGEPGVTFIVPGGSGTTTLNGQIMDHLDVKIHDVPTGYSASLAIYNHKTERFYPLGAVCPLADDGTLQCPDPNIRFGPDEKKGPYAGAFTLQITVVSREAEAASKAYSDKAFATQIYGGLASLPSGTLVLGEAQIMRAS